MSLGSRLKKARERKGWSQLYASKLAKIANTALSNYERDYRDPDSETLSTLADLYEVSIDWLAGRTENPSSPKDEMEIDPNINVAYLGGVKHELTPEIARRLKDDIELFKRMKEQFIRDRENEKEK